jgi:Protein phosphatase 2C
MSSFAGGGGASKGVLKWQCGSETDIGGGRENQDECFIWNNEEAQICVLCVLDGHGREVGRIAAVAAKVALQGFLDENYQELFTTPYECLVRAHDRAHESIKATFKTELEGQGFIVMEDPSGFLLKRRSALQNWACVHGGTSCSIVALVGTDLIIANVGDSSGTLCAPFPVLSRSLIAYVGDSALDSSSEQFRSRFDDMTSELDRDIVAGDTLVLTAEHSPESPSEFYRLRSFRPREGDPHQPSLLVVYDSQTHDKLNCAPCFSLDESGAATITNKGK